MIFFLHGQLTPSRLLFRQVNLEPLYNETEEFLPS